MTRRLNPAEEALIRDRMAKLNLDNNIAAEKRKPKTERKPGRLQDLYNRKRFFTKLLAGC